MLTARRGFSLGHHVRIKSRLRQNYMLLNGGNLRCLSDFIGKNMSGRNKLTLSILHFSKAAGLRVMHAIEDQNPTGGAAPKRGDYRDDGVYSVCDRSGCD